MLEFILDILFNNPEGLTFALFGLKKKRRKAERLIRQMEEKGIPELDALNSEGGIPDIPQFDNSIPRTTSITTPPNSISYQPEFPYRGKQIIIDSDRVLLNAKDDSVFIIGDKAVGISTNGTFNVDSGEKTIINSPQIDLGLEAIHPAVKGDVLVTVIQQFLLVLTTQVCPQLQAATDSNNVDIASVNRAGDALQASAVALNELLVETLSEKVKIQ